MFYVKLYSFILKDKTLTMKEKIVMSFFISKWESLPDPKPPKEKERYIEIKISYMAKDLGMDRRNLYKIIDSLKAKKCIVYSYDTKLKSHFVCIFYKNELMDFYYQTRKILRETKELWKKEQ